MAIPNQDLRTCTKCGDSKPVNAFYNRSRKGGGHVVPYGECKECVCAKLRKARVRTCTICEEQKPLREFYPRSTKNGEKHLRYYQCKRCVKSENRRRLNLNRENFLARDRVYAAKMRVVVKDEAFERYGGYVCACCGETEKSFLTLDHINDDGAEFRKGITKGRKNTGGGQVTYRWLRRHGYPDGLQVLCHNCQWGKRMNKGVCPHQIRRNDHPQEGVGPSGPKRTASTTRG